MGEYYSWVNIDKKEYIDPIDFNLGCKLHETIMAKNDLLGALYSLMASDWKNDAIVFLGDETEIIEEDSNLVLNRLLIELRAWGESDFAADYILDNYKCISGLFKAAKEEVCSEIDLMLKENNFYRNRYRVNSESPYEGLFSRDSEFFRYTINHSKKVFFDIKKTKLIFENSKDDYEVELNPLPILLAFRGSRDNYTGVWLGDLIEVSDEVPPEEYTDMSFEYVQDFCNYL